MFPWKEPEIQFAFYVNAQYWMPHARIFAQKIPPIFVSPTKVIPGLKLVLIGKDLNWRACGHFDLSN